ncbi:MAG: response regulator [Bacteroidota bacterium]
MNPYRILIVEDEILIADTLQRYIHRKGWEVVGIASSYEEATYLYSMESPDLVLLDIQLDGRKTGIDVGQFIQQQVNEAPFIFLTSQYDKRTIDLVKNTFPAGYLSKPLRASNLYAGIEIALHKSETQEEDSSMIQLCDGATNHLVAINDIITLEAHHVYVEVLLEGSKRIVQRSSLRELLQQLPRTQFVQTHRSYAVNVNHVNHWDMQNIYLNNHIIPISRTRRKAVFRSLEA